MSAEERRGYWVVDANAKIPPDVRDRLADLLPQAAAAGKQIVVVDGLDLRWHDAEADAGLDAERLAAAICDYAGERQRLVFPLSRVRTVAYAIADFYNDPGLRAALDGEPR